MSSARIKRSVYESDELPNRKDEEKAVELFYQNGEPCPRRIASELAMQRRYSVKHARDIVKMNKNILDQNTKIDRVTEILVGDPKYNDNGGVVGTLSGQTQEHARTNAKLNQIIGIGIAAGVLVPIIMGVIIAYMAT